MEKSNFFISSKSIDNTTGTGRLVIEGSLSVPKEFDDPIVELFRPIRAKYKNQLLFTILVARRDESIVCTFCPSNNHDVSQGKFLETATRLLPVIIDEYEAILDLFFSEETGVYSFWKNANKGDFTKGNENIKNFVANLGLKMPSIKEELKKLEKEGKKNKTKKPAK